MTEGPTVNIRGGGNPVLPMGSIPNSSLEPPLRSRISNAYECIMVPIQDWIDRIQGCDAKGVMRRWLVAPSVN